MTDHKALIAEARDTFGGHTAMEVAELLDDLAIAADRCEANSYSEIASICRRGSAAIRRHADALEKVLRDRSIGLTDALLYDAGYEDGLRKAQK